jgi:hypothetical protein
MCRKRERKKTLSQTTARKGGLEGKGKRKKENSDTSLPTERSEEM